MKKEITIGIIALMFAFGCGSRKAEITKEENKVKTEEKTEVKNDVVTEAKETSEIKTIVTDSTKEVIEETIIETPTQKTTKRKITRNKAIKTQNNTNTLLNEKSSDKTTTTSKKEEQKQTSKQAKNIDKKQFDVIGAILSYWWLFLILVVLAWLYKKYRKVLFI